MDKFVGSSEMNLREIFDKPPDIYEYFRAQEADNGDAMAKAVRRREVSSPPVVWRQRKVSRASILCTLLLNRPSTLLVRTLVLK